MFVTFIALPQIHIQFRSLYTMKFLSLFILLNLAALNAVAQNGKFYLTNYAPDNAHITNENFAIVQDGKDQMLFANSKGILKFDGRFWQQIKTPSTSLSVIYDDKSHAVFTGCINDIGRMQTDDNGNDIYVSIRNFKGKNGYFSKIVVSGDYVYFLGVGSLIEYDKKTQKISKEWNAEAGYEFSHIFKIGNTVFAYELQDGLFKIEKGEVVKLKADVQPITSLAFATQSDANSAFLGTTDGKFYFFNGVYLREIILEDASYIKNEVPFDAIVLNANLAAIATYKGGVVLFNPTNGQNVSIVNFYSGLPDDEIYSIGSDRQSGLWIAHEYGLTRLDYFLPFKNFSTYPGLEGNITAALTYQNKLYAGTNEGVFYLDKVTDFAELEKVVKIRKKKKDKEDAKSEAEAREGSVGKVRVMSKLKSFFSFGKKRKENEDTVKAQPTPTEAKVEEKPKDKKFLGIFGKKNKARAEEPVRPVPAIAEPKPVEKPVPVVQKKKVAKPVAKVEKKPVDNTSIELQTIKYAFKKISGITAKCRQIIAFDGKLLVATNNGLYEINGTAVKKISDQPISFLHVSDDKKRLVAGTDFKSILSFNVGMGSYQLENSISNLDGKVTGIIDAQNNVWFTFNDFILKFSDYSFSKADTIPVDNPYSESVHLFSDKGKMYVVMASKAYLYDAKSKALIKDTSMFKSNQDYLKLIHSEEGVLWIQNSGEWKLYAESMSDNKNFAYLNLFKDIQQIYVGESKKSCWVITKSNSLYQFDISNKAEIKNVSNIFLKNISDKQGRAVQIKEIELKEESGNINFTFINPEYLDNASLLYQHKLKGMNDSWSEWSNDNNVIFNYLPSGSYELQVRTKNAIGQLEESIPFDFYVRPPYWKEWWFYLSEFVFFGGLLVLSIWLNNHSKLQNDWLSKGLTFLTIVMMIEFVNTVFESYLKLADSPVLSFLVQVLLAIMILPFEKVLSKFIIHDSKNTLAKVASVGKKAIKPKEE